MKFYKNQIFHIYNQGNNKRQIFFTDENYEFFVWKMRAYLLPFGDFVSWSLMPNHFHWQFYVKETHIIRKVLREHIDKVEYQRRVKKYGKKAHTVKRDHTRTANKEDLISLNNAIGDMQVSYARALNREKEFSGSLFRNECQAKDGWIDEFVTVTKNGRDDFRFMSGTNYGFLCFNYIHENAVKAKIVKEITEYKWSSARDYAGLRNGTLCDLVMGRNLVQFM